MSDVNTQTQTGEEKTRYETHLSFKKETERMIERLKSGDAPFLPNIDGFADTKGVRSAITGNLIGGMNQILAKCGLHDKKDASTAILTLKQAGDCHTYIKKGEEGFTLSYFDATEKVSKSYRYFSANQVHDSNKLPRISEPVKNQELTQVQCFYSEPDKYLAKYLTAVSVGAEFKVSSEVAEGFRKNMLSELQNGLNRDEKKFTRLFEIGNAAHKLSREERSAMGLEKQVSQEQKEPEQKKSPNRKKASQELTR